MSHNSVYGAISLPFSEVFLGTGFFDLRGGEVAVFFLEGVRGCARTPVRLF